MAVCPQCGQDNPEGFAFCGTCGNPIKAAPGVAREERKVVTVLFADLVDFTSRAERMDPEDVRATLSPYYARLRSDIERHGGTVEKFIGDAVVALFGAPVAHEDDPERAVRAALAIRDAIAEMNEADPKLDLHVRVGVNTGEALITLGARPSEGEGMAAGDVVNTAARLQTAAPTDGILVGEATYRATAHSIEFREAEAVEAKGKSDPVPVWQAGQARSRLGFDVVRAARTPLVGREREVAILRDTLERARAERTSQLVTLVGEPGIGKSRLVFELLDAVERIPELIYWRQGRCLPYGEGVSFWALAEMVKSQAGILETDPDEQAEDKLRHAVTDLVADKEEAGWIQRHLRPLLGLARSEERREDRQAEAFAAWRRFIEALAERNSAVLVFEDLHWADDGLLDFIDHLVDWSTGVQLLVVCTARPELLARRSDWGGGKPNATTVSLSPLSGEETARLLSQLLERSVLPAEVQTVLLDRAGGNPLYAEEFARMVADHDAASDLSNISLPESIQGIIAARLDGLTPDDKDLLQDAAVLGKVFWLGAVAAIGGTDRRQVEQRLHELERRQFVRRDRRSSVAGETEYAFWHLLVRDVAYNQIPRGRRAEKHRLAADWLTGLSPERLEDRAEMLAHHYLAALEFARAAGQDTRSVEGPAQLALRVAGDRALALNSFSAAERFFREAVDLWPRDAPDRPHVLFRYGRALWIHANRGAQELTEARDGLLASGDDEAAAEAEIMIGNLLWLDGRRDPAFEHFDRARSLIEGRSLSQSKAWVLAHVSRFLMLAGRNQEAIGFGRQVLAMAEELGLETLRANALNNIGCARVGMGDRAGLADVENSIAIGEEANSPWDVWRGYVNLASMSFLLGDLPRSREMYERAAEEADRYAIGGGARWLRAERALYLYQAGEWDEALRIADEFIAEVESGSPHYMEGSCRVVRAYMRLARGDLAGALEDSARGLSAAREARDPQIFHAVLGERARVLLLAGRAAEAEATADELLGMPNMERPDVLWSWWSVPVAIVLTSVGRGSEVAGLMERPPPTPWNEAAQAVAAGDFATAADLFAEIGSLPDEAFFRIREAERLLSASRSAEAETSLGRALAFYQKVGATAYMREAETLLASTA